VARRYRMSHFEDEVEKAGEIYERLLREFHRQGILEGEHEPAIIEELARMLLGRLTWLCGHTFSAAMLQSLVHELQREKVIAAMTEDAHRRTVEQEADDEIEGGVLAPEKPVVH